MSMEGAYENGAGPREDGSENPEQEERDRGHRAKAHELRLRVDPDKAEGDAEGAGRNEQAAEVEDALAEFEERAAAVESLWLSEGWRAGSSWDVVAHIRNETSSLEHEVVLEGEDPRAFDRWRRSEDLTVGRGLRVVRRRLPQFQKLLWRAEILSDLGQEILDAEANGTEPPTHATGLSKTAGALDYRDEMLAKWRASRGG